MARQTDQLQNPLRIIGIGNLLAGDDAAGIRVANKLRKLQLSGVDILVAEQAPLDILNFLEGAEWAILVDAIKSRKAAGMIVRLEFPRDLAQLNSFTWTSGMPSTHMLGLGEALSLGIELKSIPSSIILYGIELGQTQMGETLSPIISEAIDTAVKHIVDEIKGLPCRPFNQCQKTAPRPGFRGKW